MSIKCSTKTKAYIWFQDLKIGGGSSLNGLVGLDMILINKVLDIRIKSIIQKRE